MEMPGWDAVLDFWFAEEHRAKWFVKDAGFDDAVAATLAPWLDAARAGRLGAWPASPRGALARVLLFDQAPRNLSRGTAEAFALDPWARALARQAVAAGHDRALDAAGRLFLYLPFEHSEDPADQDLSVRLIAALGDAEWTRYAERHREIVRRFGRFPHRNAALGRATTAAEAAFLEEPESSF
jgi:uncharacterized protein (DUF924 family)